MTIIHVQLYAQNKLTIIRYGNIFRIQVQIYPKNKLTIVRYGLVDNPLIRPWTLWHIMEIIKKMPKSIDNSTVWPYYFIDKVLVQPFPRNKLTTVWYGLELLKNVDNILIWLLTIHWHYSYTAVANSHTIDNCMLWP